MISISNREVRERVEAAVAACLDKKATDLRILHTGKVSSIADYFVICSTSSERQAKAVSEAVEGSVKSSYGVGPILVEGKQPGSWILLDYGDFVIHVFTQEVRDYYRLERLWEDAPDVTREIVSEQVPEAVLQNASE